MFAENKNLIEQITVREKIKKYLDLGNKSEYFIDQFDKDYDFGIVFLWSYAKWSQVHAEMNVPNEESSNTIVQKSEKFYDWFVSAVKLIDSWDSKRELEEKECVEFDKLISLVQYFQHIDSCLPPEQDIVAQALRNTNIKKPKKEYAIASLLTLDQLRQLLKTENIIQDNKLVIIDSHNQITALFKSEEKYYYFDPNNKLDEIQTDSIDEIAKLIFNTNFYTISGGRTFRIINTKAAYVKPSPLGFRMFSFDEKQAKYPIQKNVLDNIHPSLISEEDYAYGYSGLMIAAKAGSLESVQYFLDKGINPNRKTSNGLIALMLAAYYDHVEIIKALLVNQNTDPNTQDDYGWTALMFASKYGYHDTVKVLVANKNTNPNVQNDSGQTALLIAVKYNHPNVVKELSINKNTDPNILDGDRTVLMQASNSGHLEIVKALLAYPSIDPNIKDGNGNTALMLATQKKHIDIIKALLIHPNIDPNIRAACGWNALKLACVRPVKIDVIKALLTHPGIDFNVHDSDSGWAILRDAVITEEIDIVKVLLTHPNLDLNARDIYGWTILRQATMHNRVEIVKILLEHPKIDLTVLDNVGWTDLKEAAMYNYVEVVKTLLAHPSIDPNKRDSHGWTVLKEAVIYNYVEVVKALLTHPNLDPNPNVQDSNGCTVLEEASNRGHFEIVEALIQHPNFDPNKQGKDGYWNALMAAQYKKRPDIAKILLLHPKVDPNTKNDFGATVLELAVRYGYFDVVKTLVARPNVDLSQHKHGEILIWLFYEDNGGGEIAEDLLKKQKIAVNLQTDVNLQNEWGGTPLILASVYGYFDVVKTLLTHPNINPNLQEKNGNTALMRAVCGGYIDIVEEHLAHSKVDLNIRNKSGKTVFDLEVSDEIRQLLQTYKSEQEFYKTEQKKQNVLKIYSFYK